MFHDLKNAIWFDLIKINEADLHNKKNYRRHEYKIPRIHPLKRTEASIYRIQQAVPYNKTFQPLSFHQSSADNRTRRPHRAPPPSEARGGSAITRSLHLTFDKRARETASVRHIKLALLCTCRPHLEDPVAILFMCPGRPMYFDSCALVPWRGIPSDGKTLLQV